MNTNYRPTAAFVGASWGALIIGMAAYLIGLWNAQIQLNEKGSHPRIVSSHFCMTLN
jgi:uncharacterized membrane protein YiaA